MYATLWGFSAIRSLCIKLHSVTVDSNGAGLQSHPLPPFGFGTNPHHVTYTHVGVHSLTMRTMSIQRLIFLLVFFACLHQTYGQTKSQIIDSYVNAFNNRDIEAFLAPMHDSVRQFKFPNQIVEKSKAEIRKSYTSAFGARELGGQLTILGRIEVGDVYIIEQSLQRANFKPVDQYVLFRFSGEQIIEIHYLPKYFSWPKNGFDR